MASSIAALVALSGPLLAQTAPTDGNVTVVPREVQPADARIPVQFVALLTADGQRIEQGVTWRIFRDPPEDSKNDGLITTQRGASPSVPLKPGSYIVNAAFGRAHLTRRITVPETPPASPMIEQFVINAGGLRVNTMIGGKPAPPASVSYVILTDRDQTNERKVVISGAKPGLIIRLNAGIYHVVSTYGDANATVSSDVTVEAGKLTEATLQHAFGKVSFKLVDRAGGEALAGTHWTIQTPEGTIVKESVGALPSHTLAPGRYTVVARAQNKAFRRDFDVQDGRSQEIEIILE